MAQPRPDLSRLTEDLDLRLDALIEVVEGELDRAERVLRSARSHVDDLRRQRDSLIAMRQLASRPQLHVVSAPVEYPPKPRAVVALLRANPGRPYRLIELRNELIARGWMSSDRASIHALEVAVRNLEARGAVRRTQRGVYELAVDDGKTTEPGIGVQS